MNKAIELLTQIEAGDQVAAERLLPLVYDELRRLAASKLHAEKPGQTLTPTALVHEAYLRLTKGSVPQEFNGRAHFFGAAAQAMRRILVERAREKNAQRHGGGFQRQDFFEDQLEAQSPPPEILEVHEALEEFTDQHPEVARLVELKYFVGLSLNEASDVLGISVRTAHRQWAYAKAWLKDAIAHRK